MFNWVPYAMVRILLFFGAGILLFIYQPMFFAAQTVAVGTVLFFLGFLLFRSVKSSVATKVISGGFALACLFFLGYWTARLETESLDETHLLHSAVVAEYYEAVVLRYPEEKEKSWKTEVMIRRIHDGRQWQVKNGRVLLYLSKEGFAQPFRYGDVLLVRGNPQIVSEPANPYEFDYKRFLSFRKIYHQHFVREQGAKKIGEDPPSRWMAFSLSSRSWADRQLRSVMPGVREGAIASALVLGVTDGLDDELLQAYSATGAMHVLAVSGLHVGIIYWILLLFLKPLQKFKQGAWLIAGISLAALWLYAFVTGLSPSVLRAVTMFSFVAVAKPWKRSGNVYNTMASAAFCLLLYEPYLVMSVGFQLSFIAVLGIIFIHPLIYPWWEPRNRILDEIWKITSVSIAAQLATFALGLLYFYQFPNYFLFSNLLVIPISFVVLVAGLAVLAFSWLQPVMLACAFVLEWSIKLMNASVFLVESLPYSLLENIHISVLQCWMLIVGLVMLILTFNRKRFAFLLGTFICSVVFTMEEWLFFAQTSELKKWTVYKVAGHSAWEMTQGHVAYYSIDSAFQGNVDRMRFHIRPNRLHNGVDKMVDIRPYGKSFDGYSLFMVGPRTLLQIHRPNVRLPDHIRVDWLLISNNAITDWSYLIKKVSCREVVLDGSNSRAYVRKALRKAGP